MGRMAGLVRQWDTAYLQYLEARSAGDKQAMDAAKREMDECMDDTMQVMEVCKVHGVIKSIR